jgi:hypothetical protein
LILILIVFVRDAGAMECGWYFNWYCPGCRHIGAPTSGKGGPYSSESACRDARSSAMRQTQRGQRGRSLKFAHCVDGIRVGYLRIDCLGLFG